MAFSIPRNVSRLLDTDHISPDAIPVLDSIRFFSIVWVILGHSYLFINWQLMRDFRRGQTYIKDFAFQAVMSGFVSVDSFFFISGLLVSYLTVKHVLKDGEKSFNIPIFIIRRVWRLLPSTLLLLGLTLLVPFVGHGPIWHETTDIIVNNCRKNWWTNVLFFNNYLHATEQCQSTTWFTACDMQMFLAGMVFLAIVIRKPVAGFVLLAILIIFSVVSTAVITYIYQLPPTLLFISPDPRGILDLWHYTHFKPHVHIGSYAIGLGLGYIFAHKKFPKFSQIQKSVGWFFAIVLALLVVYGPYEWNHTRAPTVVESVLYNGFHRPIWIASLAWMTYACNVGFGGIINSILSWRGFIPLSRLTYVAYLWHATVIWVYIGNLHGSIDTSHYVMVWMFLGNLLVSFALAFLFHIICEAPFAQLETIVIGRRREVFSKKENPTNDHEIPTINGKSYGPNGVVVYKM